jgi:hypothetical protein
VVLIAVARKSTIFRDTTPACVLLSRWYVARLIRPWLWIQYIPPKRRLTFNGIHSVISQKTILFKQYFTS